MRIFDAIAVAAVAVVVLLPKASLEAHPALAGAKVELDRVAALEDARYADPQDVAAAVDLAQAYLDLLHPDFALATLAQFAAHDASPSLDGDARVQLALATAPAERLEAQATVDAAARGTALCDTRGCPEPLRTRLNVISSSMKVLIDQHIDARRDPKAAAAAVSHVLHSTRPPPPRVAPHK